ncbi:MAG: M48 family metalloprotease [Caldilineaceae bacterium]|nr:M48 family metalloprotease [Caldilineaceae bacterium]
MYTTTRRRRSSGLSGRLLLALVLVAFAVGSYYMGTSRVENPVTGEVQRVSLTPEQEIAMGLQAVSEMARQYGGLYQDQQLQNLVDQVGDKVVIRSEAARTPYEYDFHLLADRQTVNAFALPGGQIFITYALLERLATEGELAGVLSHEVGHVVARHSAERIAKSKLTEGLTNAAVIATYDPGSMTGVESARMAQLIGSLVNMKYSRSDELEADYLGVRFMAEAGYDPRSLIKVMQILAESGGGGQPEFMSTHPSPNNRVGQIEKAIEAEFPNGVPDNLQP